ncbi:MAG TPA: hypothetical protein VFM02_02370 [Candidatus Paceibacterota bacterium]|nr:hypothetical protein [Candidatus Paceibacterota bacterium]
MNFPSTNKIHREPQESNAKILEDSLKKIDWKYLIRCYVIGFSIFVVSIFVLIVAVRAAFMIF